MSFRNLLTNNSNESEESSDESKNFRVPLEKHVAFFGGGEDISLGSIYHQNVTLGDTPFEAITNATAVSAIAGVKLSGCPFRHFKPRQATMLIHAYHTGLYNKNGTINEDVWDELCDYAIQANIVEEFILTKSQFYRFLAARRQFEESWDLFAKKASDGEWAKFWVKFGEQLSGDEQYITLKNMRLFLENPAKLAKKLEQKVQLENELKSAAAYQSR